MGCDISSHWWQLKLRDFNPRTHVGCDAEADNKRADTKLFQSTHPRGVRRKAVLSIYPLINFNPRTHVGCDLYVRVTNTALLPFQSTHPRGVRHLKIVSSAVITNISIHAPTWGATIITLLVRPSIRFQSTHPRGVRHTYNPAADVTTTFQSTHPRGVRLPTRAVLTSLMNFNPRTHVGCDNDWYRDSRIQQISIHAPTWGATGVVRQVTHHFGISIHAPTWGATLWPSGRRLTP